MISRKTNVEVAQQWNSVMQDNYGAPAIAVAKAKGSSIWDVEGKKYLDMLSGIATTPLGHSNKMVNKAIRKQAKKFAHTSNLYMHQPGIALAQKLQQLTGEKSARVFFCNSGTEANEAAFKLSRLSGKSKVVSTLGSFHGRSFGSLSLTGQPKKAAAFAPLIEGVQFIDFNNGEQAMKAIDNKTAMVIVEPIQGENGVVVPSSEYLRELRKLTTANGALLVLDCVQTGVGRTGQWFGYEYSGITPDVITLAKGLGGGLALGAMITLGEKVPHFAPGDHGSTFGGNPIAAAASLTTIEIIERKNLISRADEIYAEISGALEKLPGIDCVRGSGALMGVVFTSPIAKEIAIKLRESGVLLGATSEYVIRLAPPLTIKPKEIKEFLEICRRVIR